MSVELVEADYPNPNEVEECNSLNHDLWINGPLARRIGLLGAVLGGVFVAASIPPTPVQAEVQNQILPTAPTTTESPGEREVIYEADMSQWPIVKEDCQYTYFDEEALEYHVGLICGSSLQGLTSEPSFSDFDLTVDTSGSFEGTSPLYGVFILDGAGEEFKFYHLFWINGDGAGRYDIFLSSPLGTGFLPGGEPLTESPAIASDGDLNRVRFIRQGSTVEFLVNDETLFNRTISLKEDREVRIGVVVGTSSVFAEDGYADIAFSNFLVMGPKP